MSKELKPCPFCGGKAVHKHNDITGDYVFCEKCFARSFFGANKRAATMKWNRRVNDDTKGSN